MEKKLFLEFSSEDYPLMNFFLKRLQVALENLPDNPKPECEGFYIAHYNSRYGNLTALKIGYVPKDKEYKYLELACKKLNQTLRFGKTLSREFENKDLEQYPGAFITQTTSNVFGSAVSGHNSMVDEAIAILWTVAKLILDNYAGARIPFCGSDKFFAMIKLDAQILHEAYAPDNQWVMKLADLMQG